MKHSFSHQQSWRQSRCRLPSSSSSRSSSRRLRRSPSISKTRSPPQRFDSPGALQHAGPEQRRPNDDLVAPGRKQIRHRRRHERDLSFLLRHPRVDPFFDTSASAFVANFSSSLSGFSFEFGDFDQDRDTLTLSAYSGLNGTGTLLGTVTVNWNGDFGRVIRPRSLRSPGCLGFRASSSSEEAAASFQTASITTTSPLRSSPMAFPRAAAASSSSAAASPVSSSPAESFFGVVSSPPETRDAGRAESRAPQSPASSGNSRPKSGTLSARSLRRAWLGSEGESAMLPPACRPRRDLALPAAIGLPISGANGRWRAGARPSRLLHDPGLTSGAMIGSLPPGSAMPPCFLTSSASSS